MDQLFIDIVSLQPVAGREEGSPMVLGSPGERAELGIQQPHPFILRVQSQPGPAPPPARPVFRTGEQQANNIRLRDPFKKILAAADENICQAESILSSLGYEGRGMASLASEEEGEAGGLGSDIETNIRRLERTQAKINAALETFRNVQSLRSPFTGEAGREEADRKNASFCSLPAVETVAPPPRSAATVAAVPAAAAAPKSGLARRHSFNNAGRTEQRDSVYDGDVESSEGGCRNSAGWEDSSDTEQSNAQHSPFRNRIRGIFGSFGKGKRSSGSRLQQEEGYNSVHSDKKLVTIEYSGGEQQQDQQGFSIGQFTQLVRSLPAHNFSGRESPQVS